MTGSTAGFLEPDGERRVRTSRNPYLGTPHDLRSEYASRLVERGVPLSQVRDLLGHSSIVVTERYDRQVLDNLREAVGRLDDRQPFKNLSTSPEQLTPVESVSSTH
jgi:integrase